MHHTIPKLNINTILQVSTQNASIIGFFRGRIVEIGIITVAAGVAYYLDYPNVVQGLIYGLIGRSVCNYRNPKPVVELQANLLAAKAQLNSDVNRDIEEVNNTSINTEEEIENCIKWCAECFKGFQVTEGNAEG